MDSGSDGWKLVGFQNRKTKKGEFSIRIIILGNQKTKLFVIA